MGIFNHLNAVTIQSVIIAGIGATMMLIALAFDWYYGGCTGEDCYKMENMGVGIGDLFDSPQLNWAGNPMPLIFVIIFASVSFLIALYTIVSGKVFRRTLICIGVLSILSLLANFGYLEAEQLNQDIYADDFTLYVVPHAGWIVAFLGSIALIIGGVLGRRE